MFILAVLTMMTDCIRGIQGSSHSLAARTRITGAAKKQTREQNGDFSVDSDDEVFLARQYPWIERLPFDDIIVKISPQLARR